MRKSTATFIFPSPTTVAIMLLTIILITIIGASGTKGQIMNQQPSNASPLDINDLSITVVYDNNPYKQGLQTEWGFSAYITGPVKTILFDTGGSCV